MHLRRVRRTGSAISQVNHKLHTHSGLRYDRNCNSFSFDIYHRNRAHPQEETNVDVVRPLHWLKPLIPLKFTISPASPPETESSDQFQVPATSVSHSLENNVAKLTSARALATVDRNSLRAAVDGQTGLRSDEVDVLLYEVLSKYIFK